MGSIGDNDFYPIRFLADVFNCLTCAWFDWDTTTGRCRNHGTGACKLKANKPGPTPLGPGTIYQ
ncbi:MAG: hypothetical protein V2A77_00510 [Pseudomonadota bacterium]